MLSQDQPSIKQTFPAILSEMAKKAVAKGLKFEFDTEWDDFDTGIHFYRYEVGEDVKIEAQLPNLLSNLSEQGIDARLIKPPEKTSSSEKYVFGT